MISLLRAFVHRLWSVGPARVLASIAVFAFSWLLLYNDPLGGFGGLTDDHFYYVIRGWQMLFGELPDRDYVDAGAPLAYGISAVLQLFDRGTWSEFLFCVTALSAGAALTCLVAARATGSVGLGILAALFEIALLPRLYNYPKIIVYAVAIPALWAWISAPGTRRTWSIAAIAAVAFLLRHDHGLYVGGAFALALLVSRHVSWRIRVRQAAIYGFATLLLLAPYLAYLQVNGGIVRHVTTGYQWSERDRARAPLVLPELTWQPLSTGEPSDAPASEWWNHAPFPALDGYSTWWFFWLVELLPFASLLLLAIRPATGAAVWAHERLKIGVVAALAIVMNNGFLRGNLPIQIPDVSVPAAILAVWALAATGIIVRSGQVVVGSREWHLGTIARAAIAGTALVTLLVTALLLLPGTREQVENSSLLRGPEAIVSDTAGATERLRAVWPLQAWAGDDSRGSVQLALYLDACTAPTDKVLVTPYLPATVGLARRGFAGGHGDLRPGFFATQDEQQLTVARLSRQSVPVIIGPPRDEFGEFARSFPGIAGYFAREYVNLGDQSLGEGLVVSLFVNRAARIVGQYAPLSLPCFR